MTAKVVHLFVSAIPDGPDTSVVRPSDWNADHTITGLATVAETGAYSDLSGLPTLGTAAATDATAYATAAQGATADTAVQPTRTVAGHALSADVTVSKSDVGLGNADNTSDAAKPVSTATQTALNLKANLASPTFTGTVGGVTAAMVGAPAGSGTSSGANTGDQSSIVGISGTIAQFNTACTDADFATGGGTVTGTSSGTNTGDQNTQYVGTFTTAPASFTIAANTTYDCPTSSFVVSAGVVVTVAVGGVLRVANWMLDIASGLVDQTLRRSTGIPPGFIMNHRSFGTVPFSVPAGTVLTIPAGAALIT